MSVSPSPAVGRPGLNRDEREAIARQVRAASTSFYWAMRVLPRPRREAIFAVYAFCRAVDDIVDDETTGPAEKARGLDRWRRDIDAIYAGEARDALGRALAAAVADFAVRRADFLAVIDGMAMDAGEPIVAPPMATFDLYCDRVASAVGRLCVCIFGDPGPHGMAVAHHLGRALQITNILRDVAEDAGLGRLYLPRELLDAHGVDFADLAAVTRQPGFAALWRELAGIAAGQFAAAERAMALCRPGTMRAARIMIGLGLPTEKAFLPVALSIMVFFALCAQCASTLVVMGRETGTWRWPVFSFVLMTSLAYLAAWCVAVVGKLAGA